jgi:hypothetical protein
MIAMSLRKLASKAFPTTTVQQYSKLPMQGTNDVVEPSAQERVGVTG